MQLDWVSTSTTWVFDGKVPAGCIIGQSATIIFRLQLLHMSETVSHQPSWCRHHCHSSSGTSFFPRNDIPMQNLHQLTVVGLLLNIIYLYRDLEVHTKCTSSLMPLFLHCISCRLLNCVDHKYCKQRTRALTNEKEAEKAYLLDYIMVAESVWNVVQAQTQTHI